jgi:beta-glucosidase
MGLFEDPYVDKDEALETVGAADHQRTALEVVRDSLTLCKNDDFLPLSGDEDVFVGGPNADNLVHQVGGWSVESEEHVDGTTILEEIRAHVDGDVTHEQGAGLHETRDVEAAAEQAADADVAVLALGEGWYLHEFGAGGPRTETGEFPTREQIDIPEAQQELVDAVVETGTPVVGVLVTGRPLAVERLDEQAEAVLMAYFPGTMGGKAIAETLVGENDPSGRLPITVPRSGTQVDVHHDHLHQPRPIGDSEHPDSYDPLYPFGHGLSYTEFETGQLAVSEEVLGPGDTVELDVTVENVGDRAGTEVVQAYSATESKPLVMPERRLQAFERVDLDAGEEATVTLDVPVEQFGVYAPDDGHRVQPGHYDLVVDDEAVTVTVEGDYV